MNFPTADKRRWTQVSRGISRKFCAHLWPWATPSSLFRIQPLSQRQAFAAACDWLVHPVSVVPLVIFRIAFGLLMFASTVRFVANGWVREFYIDPAFHFTYGGFGWVQPLPTPWIYGVFALVGIAALCIAAGLWYRASMGAFFLLFTYVELLDKTYYLNHYYFISVLSMLLLFLPLHRAFSVDARQGQGERQGQQTTTPQWTVAALWLQVGLVYFFAGVAKLKPDWLLHAMPLRIWLSANTDFPLLGPLFDSVVVAYLMSWAGAAFDLTVPFLLLWRPTRPFAYGAVVVFHLMTWRLFQIGMFPWIMMASALVFFSAEDWQRVGSALRRFRGGGVARQSGTDAPIAQDYANKLSGSRAVAWILIPFFLVQLLLPLRHWLYPGNVLWTEEGYRFAWNVMLAEKTGDVVFHLRIPATAQTPERNWDAYPGEYLTPQQEKQMSFQPDMILEFAHFLADEFETQTGYPVQVRAEAYVSLNGRASRLLIDPTLDLAQQRYKWWRHNHWILPH